MNGATPHHPCTAGHPPKETSGVFSNRETGRNLRCCRSPSPNLAVSWKNDTVSGLSNPSFLLGKFPQSVVFVRKVFQLFFVGKVSPAFPKSFVFRHIFSQRVATQEAFNVITSEVFQDSNRAMLQSLRFSWNKVLPHHAILLGVCHTQPHIHSHQVDILGILNCQPKKKKKLTFPAISYLFKILVPVEIGMLPGIISSSFFNELFILDPLPFWRFSMDILERKN